MKFSVLKKVSNSSKILFNVPGGLCHSGGVSGGVGANYFSSTAYTIVFVRYNMLEMLLRELFPLLYFKYLTILCFALLCWSRSAPGSWVYVDGVHELGLSVASLKAEIEQLQGKVRDKTSHVHQLALGAVRQIDLTEKPSLSS